jgi:hypothetical protein
MCIGHRIRLQSTNQSDRHGHKVDQVTRHVAGLSCDTREKRSKTMSKLPHHPHRGDVTDVAVGRKFRAREAGKQGFVQTVSQESRSYMCSRELCETGDEQPHPEGQLCRWNHQTNDQPKSRGSREGIIFVKRSQKPKLETTPTLAKSWH